MLKLIKLLKEKWKWKVRDYCAAKIKGKRNKKGEINAFVFYKHNIDSTKDIELNCSALTVVVDLHLSCL